MDKGDVPFWSLYSRLGIFSGRSEPKELEADTRMIKEEYKVENFNAGI